MTTTAACSSGLHASCPGFYKLVYPCTCPCHPCTCRCHRVIQPGLVPCPECGHAADKGTLDLSESAVMNIPLVSAVMTSDAQSAEYVWPDCCSCKAGDGTDECPQYDACYEAWSRSRAAEVNRSRAALTKAMDNYRQVLDGTHSDGRVSPDSGQT